MEESFITYFSSYGAVGVIAFFLFKNTLDSHKQERDYFIKQLDDSRNLYKSQLEADRQVYLSSIEKITSSVKDLNAKIHTVESDVKEIKNKLNV